MSEVSGRIVAVAIELAAGRGLATEPLIDGLPLDERALRGRRARVDWDSFATFMARLGESVGGPAGLRELGRESATSDTFRIFRAVGRAVSRPADLYWIGVRWMGPALFPMIEADLVELADGRLRETLTIDPRLRDCPEIFHAMHGAFMAMPRSWGHGESEVELELRPRGATLTIRPQTTRPRRLRRFLRLAARQSAFRELLDEVEEQQAALHTSYFEMREARDRIERQARQLERIDEIGRRLAAQIEPDRLADELAATLVDDRLVAGLELWLEPADELDEVGPRELRLLRRAGATEGEPATRHDLRSAGRSVGALVVWRATAEAPPDDLVAGLVPWIAMAIDNARSYGQLREHAEALEHRVRERTARLLAANHHLVREIDERRRATEALQASEVQLRASERLASLGTLAAGIAHEINNPIGAILAAAQFATLLDDEDGNREEVRGLLDDIGEQARRCGGIVRSVLQFARNEETEKWICRVDDLVERAIRLAEPTAEEAGARLVRQGPEQPVWIRANPIQIEQALTHLIRNAVQAGAETITVRVEAIEEPPSVALHVVDDGAGIAEPDRERVLEPFFTTRRDEGGAGLGLSVVHGIVKEHVGTLELHSPASGGVEARLVLPTTKPLTRARPSPAVVPK